MNNLFDSQFNGMGRSEMYRSWLTPDLFPHERPACIWNWSDEEREMYCGVYTRDRSLDIQYQHWAGDVA